MIEETRKTIEKVKRRFVDGMRKGDAAAMAAQFTEDAILLPLNCEMIFGRKRIEKFWEASIRNGLRDQTFDTIEISGNGDMFYEVANDTAIINWKGQKLEVKEKFMCIWKHTRSDWKVHRLIWNPNQPSEE
ncbi:MAG TPA: SgcJ/EcaC family oxidoreductase [Candidatus Acidoferrum sp.]|nr:SgcJ/EcaC family oxidoreductase [Candidatus Acidoferrum sp.]